MITTSWNASSAIGRQWLAAGETETSVKAENVLFSLVIRATQDIELSAAVAVNSRYTLAEAYHNEELYSVGVEFIDEPGIANQLELHQNVPNPFQHSTSIGFFMPESATATLTITDVSGKVLYQIKGGYNAGYNVIELKKSVLPDADGVLNYTLEVGESKLSKRMILVK